MSNNTGYNRQNGNNQPKPWSLRLFILGINLILLFLILDTPLLQRIGLILIGISLVLGCISYIKHRFNGNTTTNDSVRDIFPLVRKYLKVNRRFLLASTLGLIIAIMVISQIYVVSESTTGNIYSEIFQNGVTPFTEISQIGDYPGSDVTNLHMNRNAIEMKYNDTLQEYGIRSMGMNEFSRYYFSSHSTDWNPQTGAGRGLRMRNEIINKQEFQLLQQFPTFPNLDYSHNLTLLVLDSYRIEEYNFTVVDQISENHSLQVTLEYNNTVIDIPVENFWLLTNDDWSYANDHDMRYLMNRYEGTTIIPNKSIATVFNVSGIVPSQYLMRGYIDYSSLVNQNPTQILQIITNMRNDLYTYLDRQNFNIRSIDISSQVSQRLQQAESQLQSIKFLLTILSVPMMILALYLVYFSLNLVEIRKQKQVGVMKVRGVSTTQLRMMLGAEAVFASIIATAIGMALSLPWSYYIINKSGIFASNSSIFLPKNWYWKMPIIGLILTMDLNIWSILSISETKIEESEAAEETKEPFWKRFYLDVLATIIGAGILLTMKFVNFDRTVDAFFTYQIGPIALLLFIFGLPLFVSRYYSTFLTILSDFLWKRTGNLVALATRNMRKNKFSASKLAVLLMIGMMFSFVAISVPNSLKSWNQDRAHYEVGSDFAITGLDSTNSTHFEPLTNNTDITAITSIKRITVTQTMLGPRERPYNNIIYIGINSSTYRQAAYWDASFSTTSLQRLMDALQQGKVLVQSDALDVLDVKVGEDILLPINRTDSAVHNVGGSFKYWPRSLDHLYRIATWVSDVIVILPMDVFNTDYSIYNVSTVTALARTSNNVNQTAVLEQLKEDYRELGGQTLSFGISSAQEFLESYQVTDQNRLMFTIFDTLLLVTAITSVIGVGYFSFITLSERKREIGVFRAVGMVSTQIFVLLVIEALVLALSSIILGDLAGIFVTDSYFMLIGSDVGQIPPLRLRFNARFTFLYSLAILLLSIISAAIPARITAKQQTGSILRAE